jgi:tetratricopeptide (TPR) repeat protein
MPIARPLIVFLLLCLLLLAACSKEENAPSERQATAAAAPTRILLKDALTLQRFELTPEALSVWRQGAGPKPTLLLLSNDPLLQPVPETLLQQVAALVKTASGEELAARGSLRRADPLLAPQMTLDAALRTGLFAKVIWAVPRQDDAPQIDARQLGAQLVEAALATDDEAATLKQQRELVVGRLRGTPLAVGTLSQLIGIAEPVVVHIDQSYFQKLYKNEIKTPLLPIIYDTLKELRSKNIPVLAVTFSYGNLEGRVDLQVRFVGEILARLIENPAELDQPVPANWQRQMNVFHLGSLLQKDKAREVALAMEKEEPDKAWVQYTLYKSAQENRIGDEALEHLTKAVHLDRIYALEYEVLAGMAYDRGRPEAALQVLQHAGTAFPEDPFLQLKIAQLASEIGDNKNARFLVDGLHPLPWSPVFYPEMPDYLKGFAAHLEGK